MICEECAAETSEGRIKKFDDGVMLVCPDCKKWKGKGNPLSAQCVKSGLVKGA